MLPPNAIGTTENQVACWSHFTLFSLHVFESKFPFHFPFFALHNLYAFMESSMYKHQCIVNRTTTYNDTLERIGVGAKKPKEYSEEGDDNVDEKAYLHVYAKKRKDENEKFHYTFILWHHEFSDCFLLLCYYCLLESYMLMMYKACSCRSLSHFQQNNISSTIEMCTNLHVTIICVWQRQPLQESSRKVVGVFDSFSYPRKWVFPTRKYSKSGNGWVVIFSVLLSSS